MKVAEIPGGGKTAALEGTPSGVKGEEAETRGTRGKSREGRKMSQVGAGLAGLHHTQLTAAEQPLSSGTLESGGHSGREGEEGRRHSRGESVAPKRDWRTADVHGCFRPSGRFPEINPLSPPPPLPLIPPSSCLPGPPRCPQVVRQVQGGGWCCASSGKGQGSAWARSSAEACPPSRRFYPGTTASLLCSHRSGHSPGPRTNHRPGPGRSESSPGSAPLSCCGNTCVDRPVGDKWGATG